MRLVLQIAIKLELRKCFNMKKVLFAGVLGFGIALTGLSAQAACENYVCPQNVTITSGFSRFMSNVTCQNFLAERIAGHFIKKAIKKNVISGDFKVDFDSYSVRDLKAGKFKSLKITGKNVNVEGIYLTETKMETLCEYNYIVQDKKNKDNLTIMNDIPVNISLVINEADLNKTMQSKDYTKMLGDINSLGGSLNIFKIDSTCIKIKKDRLYYIVKFAIPFVRGTQDVVMTTDLKVKNGQIAFANAELLNNHTSLDLSKVTRLLNYVNPLDFSLKILENKDANIKVNNVDIQDGKILIDGRMTILKDTDT